MSQPRSSPGPLAVILLGAAVWPGGIASPSLQRRAEHAARKFLASGANWLVLCGGVGKVPPAEAKVAARIALAEGVPAEALLLDETSGTTLTNLENAKRLLAAKGCRRAIIVTDYYHLPRAVMTARSLGLIATGSAPRHDLGKTAIRRHVVSVLREIPALAFYIFKALRRHWR